MRDTAIDKLALYPDEEKGGAYYSILEIFKADSEDVKNILREETPGITEDELKKRIDNNDFYAIFLDISVDIPDPHRTFILYNQMSFSIGNEAKIITFDPKEELQKGKLTKSGKRTYELSGGGSAGFSIKQTSETKESKTEATVGPQVELKGKLGSESSYSFDVPISVEEIVGVRKGNAVEWSVYGNQEYRPPVEEVGRNVGFKAGMLLQVPKEKTVSVKVSNDGKFKGEGTHWYNRFISRKIPINLRSPSEFKVPEK